MFTKPRSVEIVSASAGAASAISASTESVEARPWWHVMQRASGPSPSTVAPEGKVTADSALAASL